MGTLGVEGRRIQQPQVLLACLRNPVAAPLGDGAGADTADAGQAGGATERLDNALGLGVRGVGSCPHGADYRHAERSNATVCRRTDNQSVAAPAIGHPKLCGMKTTTFTDRIVLATEGLPRGFQTALAKACGMRPSSVNDWLSGKSKTASADLVFPAARFLNVNPEWLATGKGPMRPSVGDVKADDGTSQGARLDAQTLGKAMRFARLWLTITGDSQPLEKHPHLVLEAARVIDTLEANIESEDELAQVMAKLAAMGGTDGARRGTVG